MKYLTRIIQKLYFFGLMLNTILSKDQVNFSLYHKTIVINMLIIANY